MILGRALARAGYRDLLETLAETTSTGTPLGETIRLGLDGLVAEARGEPDRAAGLFRSAVDRWQSWSWAPELAHAHEALARVLAQLGDADGAAVHQADATELWRAIRAGGAVEAAVDAAVEAAVATRRAMTGGHTRTDAPRAPAALRSRRPPGRSCSPGRAAGCSAPATSCSTRATRRARSTSS